MCIHDVYIFEMSVRHLLDEREKQAKKIDPLSICSPTTLPVSVWITVDTKYTVCPQRHTQDLDNKCKSTLMQEFSLDKGHTCESSAIFIDRPTEKKHTHKECDDSPCERSQPPLNRKFLYSPSPGWFSGQPARPTVVCDVSSNPVLSLIHI